MNAQQTRVINALNLLQRVYDAAQKGESPQDVYKSLDGIAPGWRNHFDSACDRIGSNRVSVLREMTAWLEVTPAAAKAAGLTEDSLRLFLAYAKDSGNWGGHPYVDGNVGLKKEERGNLTQLKRRGLLKTQHDKTENGGPFIIFTDAGKRLAAEYGHPIQDGH